MLLTLALVFLIFLVLFYYNTKIQEHFSCFPKHYYKSDKDTYEPIEEMLCTGMTDEECADYNADCIISNIDSDKISDENSEEIEYEIETQIKYCMKPTTDVVFDEKCIKRELNSRGRREIGGRRQSRSTSRRNRIAPNLYKIIMKKCEIKSNQKKYTLDPNCVLFK